MKTMYFFVAVLFATFAIAQIKEERQVGNFTKLKTSTSVNVIYKQVATGQNITVEWDEDLIKYLKTEVKNNVLSIYIDDNNNFFKSFNTRKLKVYVSNPGISIIQSSSSSDVVIEGDLNVKELLVNASSSASVKGKTTNNSLKINASSSANVTLETKTDQTLVDASSSADVILKGSTLTFEVQASSSADISAKEFNANAVNAKASSSADIVVFAQESINAKASSSGDVVIYGNPKNVKKEENSGGDIIQK